MTIDHPDLLGHFIGGRRVTAPGRDTIEVRNPANGARIATILHGTEADVDLAVKDARRTFDDPAWRDMSIRTRARLVNKLADAIESRLEDLYRLETLNNGRPVNETRAQLGRIPDFFRYNAGLALARRDAVIPVEGDYLNYTLRTPIGVVGNSTPFNHPLVIMCKSLAPVFASGCTTVVKPSEYTPLTTMRLAELLVEAGLPPGVFNVVNGYGPTTGKALAEHRDVAKFILTGGTEAGRAVGALAGAHFARQTLELGGKTAVIVFDDYDVDRAVDLAAFGAFVAAGQTCVCAARHIVHESIYDRFVERLVEKARRIRIGDPSDPRVQMGPMVSDRQRQRVLDYVRIGIEEGATLATGGRIPEVAGGEGGYFIEPTVFSGVTPAMRIAREEVFGPLTVVIPFRSEDEALAIANDSPYGLAGAVRTTDVSRAHRVASRLQCGIVWINDHHRIDPASPWGGVKDSGIGREWGTESWETFFDTKSVMVPLRDDRFDWYTDTDKQTRLN